MTTWLTTKEAAEHLGVSTKTLYRRIADGTLAAYRLAENGPYKIRLEDLEKQIKPVNKDTQWDE